MILQQATQTAAVDLGLGVVGGQCAVYTMLLYVGVQLLGGILHRFGVTIPVITPVVDGMASLMASGRNILSAVGATKPPPAAK